MEELKRKLEERKQNLLQIKKEKENSLLRAPDGTLHVCSSGGRTQYYHRTNRNDCLEVYIRDKDIQLAQRLAQKDYDKKVLKALDKEINAIDKFIANFPVVDAEQVYETLHKGRQELIKPIYETDEQFIEHWEHVNYQGKSFEVDSPEYYTAKGERVRSKSEVIIADALEREKIPYRYEWPITLSGLGRVHPDFTVLNIRTRKEFYWEHFGMMDDSDYVENAVFKISKYEQNGLYVGDKLIFTFETRKTPINQKQIKGIIQKYLM